MFRRRIALPDTIKLPLLLILIGIGYGIAQPSSAQPLEMDEIYDVFRNGAFEVNRPDHELWMLFFEDGNVVVLVQSGPHFGDWQAGPDGICVFLKQGQQTGPWCKPVTFKGDTYQVGKSISVRRIASIRHSEDQGEASIFSPDG